jgi:hypothetical protein
MQIKNIIIIVLTSLVFFYKRLNVDLNHVGLLVGVVILYYEFNKESLETFDETEKIIKIKKPKESVTRRNDYNIISNINSPSNIGFSNS